MFSLAEPLWLLPLCYGAALLANLFPWAHARHWALARLAGYGGALLVLVALLLALLDGRDNDRLGLVMAALVSLLGLVILDYSERYLRGEPGQRRFILALLGTLASVATVVSTGNLYLLVGAWILSSLCLHPLLTFYRDRPAAVIVAHKKFIASRLADACLIAAAALLIQAADSHQLPLIVERLASAASAGGGLAWPVELALALLVLAVILKSAQLPVHGWLIQVMEAPTPVSALLHAGLVNLGGFVLLRFAPLLSQAPVAQTLLVLVGGLTAVLAALVMMTRVSIKVRLAWSTCAQMGFMLMECGLGLYELALVHLLAHSLYKAHAFLTAGEVVGQVSRHALYVPERAPGLGQTLLALPLAGLWVLALHGLWTSFLPQHALPAAALALLAVGLAPWCIRRASWVHGVLVSGVLLAAYLLWHLAAASLLVGTPRPGPYQDALAALVVMLFIGLYLLQAWITSHPHGALARRLHQRAFAGFHLDEYFTRLTFRLWPVRAQ
ncbi:NADH-quinone oxidoreductase subunit L [Pseudomonas sp. A46]|nr:NADH-quinone oxidoreductase subunit L [Pseudomonas sp. A46]OWJ90350.1 NADH-quinone oxidoreductase subunit L [Pseudomonas sp. A46]